jgi:UDP-3-O-[3-hydroxymyristoyl] glucosamine N-acyltransferase
MKLSALLAQLGNPTSSLATHADLDPDLTGINAVDEANSGDISYIDRGPFTTCIDTTAAAVLILPDDSPLKEQAIERNIAWIETKNPRLLFAQTIDVFYKPYQPAPSIHPSAVVDQSAKLGQNVAIAAHAVIGANSVIGDDVCIFPNVVVYPDCTIGDRTVLHANCTIEERSIIGTDCVIHSGAVIGAEGFGFVPTREGWYKMQQSGYVKLGDRVEIGCNSTIDRPAVGNTSVGDDTKMDNMVHIGHGCQIGRGCAFAAQVGLAGGVEVGDRVILAGQVGIANTAKIGNGAIVSSKSGVTSRVAPGQTFSGYPAVDHRTYLKVSAIYSKIPELYQWYRRMKKDYP